MSKYTDLLEACAGSTPLSRELALQMLDENLPEDIWDTVREAADRRAREYSGGNGRVYATIGVDAAPCPINCLFCSHGEQWCLTIDEFELSPEDLIERLRLMLDAGTPDWFTLRTTQYYGHEKLLRVCREARKVLPPETMLIVNTGEFTVEQAKELADAGVERSYHTFRPREGDYTGIKPEDRLATLAIIRDSPLKLAALIEPVGPEHTDEELVDIAFLLKDYGVSLGGAMARVPVKGTPLYELGSITPERHTRLIAMTRLVYGPEVPDICVHPPVPEALRAGANTIVVETGAVPRDEAIQSGEWHHFGMRQARELLERQGYRTLDTPSPVSQ